jgi:VanZ family protein
LKEKLLRLHQTVNWAGRQRERRYALLALSLTLVLLIVPGSVLAGLQTAMEPLMTALKEWKALWWPWPASDDDGEPLPLDKVVHFVLFAGCGYWVARGWLGDYNWLGLLLALMAYGVLTEVIQLFVPGRGLSVADMIADAAGAAFGLLWIQYRSGQNQYVLKQNR